MVLEWWDDFMDEIIEYKMIENKLWMEQSLISFFNDNSL